ncbi:MAG: hypothetical protein HOV80_30200 [Polyangiaceae bacterium]|nr:hypothetical protein [Polyangiaceae bacterium]
MTTRWALVIWIVVAGCSSRTEVASDVPVATDTPTAPGSAPVLSSSAPSEPSASVAATPSSTVAPTASASPTDVFAAKIALLDKVDEAIMNGKPDALAALTVPSSALESCSDGGRDRGRANVDVARDCSVAAGLRPTRAAINVGSRAEVLDAACGLAKLETSELFYRTGGHSVKITVHTVAVEKETYLQRIHCDRSDRPTKEPGATNCTGKWPFVTQTREFTSCPWSKP